MENLVIKNGTVVTPLVERLTSVWIAGARILHIGDNLPAQLDADYQAKSFRAIDAAGCYVSPGLIDLQMNGGPDLDLWEDLQTRASAKADLRAMRKELLSKGVTAFLPTLITTSPERFQGNISFLKAQGAGSLEAKQEARMPGIHLEGPCLSPARPGVHPPEHIKPLTRPVLDEILDDSVKLMTAACEEDPQSEALQYLHSRGVTISLGHSNATYEEAQQAFSGPVAMLTHTFNALPPLHHRQPGAVGAALLNKKVSCCLIADGLHLAPAACQLIFTIKGPAKTILVTDRAHIGTSGGGLVGSSISLDEAVRNMTNWGICSFAQAVRMASYNAARALGFDQIGELAPGKIADLVLFDKNDLRVAKVIFNDQEVEKVTSSRAGSKE